MVSNEIIKILDELGRRIGVAVDWSNENIMPYLEELMKRFIQWDISTSIVWGLVGVVISVFGLSIARHIWKNRKNYSFFGDLDEGITWGFIGTCALLIIGIAIIVTQCFDVCKAIYLPEMAIYEYIQGLTSLSN